MPATPLTAVADTASLLETQLDARRAVPASAEAAGRIDGPAAASFRPAISDSGPASNATLPVLRASLFLSDLHLSPAIPRTVEAFERFIAEIDPTDVAHVYILGDLFEYWIGDDMLSTPFAAHIAAQLATLSQRGIALSVMHGNRDFLLGKRFARAAAATLIADPTAIDVHGTRWILTHGDALCTDDIAYQRFRNIVRRRSVQCFFLSWPLRWRMKLAGNMRVNSEQKGASRMHISDVSHQAVTALFGRLQAVHMIQGHTHRPARHVEDAAGQPVIRWVLPDWECDVEPPRGGYLRIDATGAHCRALPGLAGPPVV